LDNTSFIKFAFLDLTSYIKFSICLLSSISEKGKYFSTYSIDSLISEFNKSLQLLLSTRLTFDVDALIVSSDEVELVGDVTLSLQDSLACSFKFSNEGEVNFDL
jgi:hypothetical protein